MCDTKSLVRKYLDSRHHFFSVKKPEDFWRCVKTTGWYDSTTFILPGEIIGPQTGVYFEASSEITGYGKAGNFEKWQEQIAKLAIGNPYLVFAISCGLAGPLLKLLSIPAIGFHLLGDSTTGKTTALIVAASVWGSPNFVLSWRSTTNALEIQAASRCDGLLPLDESHLVEVKHLDSAIYVVIHVASKGRLNRDATAKDSVHWRVCVLSSGERALETHLVSAGIEHKAGQAVRLIDIPTSGKFGVFDELHARCSGALFSEGLREAAGKHYGHAGPAFIQKLIARSSALNLGDKLHETIATFKDELSPQQKRVWRAFATVAVAGQLASEWQIVPWKRETALSAATTLFRAWLRAQPQGSSSREQAQIFKLINDCIDSHGDSRFSDINWAPPVPNNYNEEPPVIRERLGYWEDSPSGRKYLFTSGGLRQATKGFDFLRVLRALEEADAFSEKGSDGEKAKKRDTPDGRSIKLYHILPHKLVS